MLKKIFLLVVPIFLFAACSQAQCPFTDSSMFRKYYSGCELGLIPATNWAILEKDGDSWGRYYRKDGQIFLKGKIDQKLENIDVPTFSPNGKYTDFAQDKNGFYFFGERLLVDNKTFELLSNTHSKDKNGVYYGVHTLEGSDPKTFEIINHSIYGQTPYSKDKNSVFYQWMKIEEADPKTFQVLDDAGHSKDKAWYYLYDKREKAIE